MNGKPRVSLLTMWTEYGGAAIFRSIVLAANVFLAINAAHAVEESRRFSCNGNMIEPTSLAPSPKSMQLVLGPAHKISIDLGQGDNTAQETSNNKLQLKFRTKEFVGEFFHYTGDLFLIYKSGHLARLTCTKS